MTTRTHPAEVTTTHKAKMTTAKPTQGTIRSGFRDKFESSKNLVKNLIS
jgi:hypothetical protein